MVRYFPLPDTEAYREDARSWLAEPGEPSIARRASTVMCLRDGPAGPEVFMIHRAPTMAFAPSMHVFPGGGVDERDGRDDLPWSGPSPEEWGRRLGTDPTTARTYVAAAVREVFEETGVLLAGPVGTDAVLSSPSGESWQLARAALVRRETSLAEVLTEAELALRSQLLTYRAHWTTPEFEPRRYDTRFFATRLPEGQLADDLTTEAQAADWVLPGRLLEQHAMGEALMMPPTVVCLEELAACSAAEEFLVAPDRVTEVMPVLELVDDGPVTRTDL